MVGCARADRPVGRAGGAGASACVSDGGPEDALVLGGRVVLEEDVLDAPEAACSEGGGVGGWGCG